MQSTRSAGPFGGMSDRTVPIPIPIPMPIPVAPAAPRPSSRGATAPLVVTIGATVLALLFMATTAVVLVTRGSAPAAPVVATAPAASAPVTVPVAAPVAASEPGPELVDTAGDAVDPEFAAVVTRVYRAVEANDLESVRKAYSAGGSDDWFTSEPHLRSAQVRSRVLAALRERPSAHDGYLYAAGNGYVVQFGQVDRYAPPGLLRIQGPWTNAARPAEQDPDVPTYAASAPVSAAPGSSGGQDCAAGTVEDPTEGYPCRDLGSGHGVMRDGTAGAHGLRPCPTGTTVPADPDEPTRNAATGEICGLY